MIENDYKEKLYDFSNKEKYEGKKNSVYQNNKENKNKINLIKKGANFKNFFDDLFCGVLDASQKSELKNKQNLLKRNHVFLLHSELKEISNILNFMFAEERWVCVIGNDSEFEKLKRKFKKVNHFVFVWDENPKTTILKKSDCFLFSGEIKHVELIEKIRGNNNFEIIQ